MNRFQQHYENILCYDLIFKDHFINVMQLPKLEHITLNTGIGIKAVLDKKQIMSALLGLQFISNQRPTITRAKKAIDKFKLREKMPIGCKVTLRKNNLYLFMDRFINRVLPVMDNSHEIFNSIYFKKYSSKRENLHDSYVSLIHVDEKLPLEDSINENPSNQEKKKNMIELISKNNLESSSLTEPYSKWTCNLFTLCSPDLRKKLWLLNKNTSNNYFLPKGKDYFFLSFKPLQQNFIKNHYFYVSLKNKKKTLSNFTNKKNSSIKTHYAIAFGFKDFISSTWLRNFGSNCGDIESSYGIDIIFVISYLKNRNIQEPHYFLSNFQMPF